MNKLKGVQSQILKFSKKTVDDYMILERSFLSFINDFCYIYFLCESNKDGLEIILNKIADEMELENPSKVISYVTDKLIDNLSNFTDFVIRKQTKETLSNLKIGLINYEQYDQNDLVVYIQNQLICHADSDDEV